MNINYPLPIFNFDVLIRAVYYHQQTILRHYDFLLTPDVIRDVHNKLVKDVINKQIDKTYIMGVFYTPYLYIKSALIVDVDPYYVPKTPLFWTHHARDLFSKYSVINEYDVLDTLLSVTTPETESSSMW